VITWALCRLLSCAAFGVSLVADRTYLSFAWQIILVGESTLFGCLWIEAQPAVAVRPRARLSDMPIAVRFELDIPPFIAVGFSSHEINLR
jgi:hypothetical protein